MALIPALWWMLRAQRLYRALPASELLRRLRAPARARAADAAAAGFGPGDGERMRVALARIGRRLPGRADCMVQSLAARMWLDRRGVPFAFRLGMRRGPAGLGAHAWIEVGGRVVTGGLAVQDFADFAGAAETDSSGASAGDRPA
ncbi:lasso peptide biosynthesis B2 protein [Albimonas pacifica]|uniref:lasso peptide biosynthesis B2 protein n=1 Tax=Albimonas pacifica TaxID=1114924 RepID=UPI0015A51337|nr:lasso peptide biosynthesis B2 protein [Albimonas pacifica]